MDVGEKRLSACLPNTLHEYGGAATAPHTTALPWEHHKKDLVKKDLSKQDLEDTQKRACEENDFVETEAEEQDGLATGEDTDQPEACRYYHPGFECEHMRAALTRVAELWWERIISPAMVRSYLNEFRAKENLHDIVHGHEMQEIEQAATYWKQSGEKLRMPLFFNQLASTLANAQSVQAPGGETALQRYARKLEEQGG